MGRQFPCESRTRQTRIPLYCGPSRRQVALVQGIESTAQTAVRSTLSGIVCQVQSRSGHCLLSGKGLSHRSTGWAVAPLSLRKCPNSEMQAHRYPPATKTNAVPENDPLPWLPVLTMLTSTAGLVGAAWLALSMLF